MVLAGHKTDDEAVACLSIEYLKHLLLGGGSGIDGSWRPPMKREIAFQLNIAHQIVVSPTNERVNQRARFAGGHEEDFGDSRLPHTSDTPAWQGMLSDKRSDILLSKCWYRKLMWLNGW